MALDVRLILNGQPVERQVEVRRSLADFLRHDLGLTGTHVGCEHGVCGAAMDQGHIAEDANPGVAQSEIFEGSRLDSLKIWVALSTPVPRAEMWQMPRVVLSQSERPSSSMCEMLSLSRPSFEV